jgi:antitoxin VapB
MDIRQEELCMAIAKVFQSGNSQAVRLPKEFRLATSEVEIFRRGNELVLREKPSSAAAIFDALVALPRDVWPDDRVDELPQEREAL